MAAGSKRSKQGDFWIGEIIAKRETPWSYAKSWYIRSPANRQVADSPRAGRSEPGKRGEP
jgi:hypothetical protein